MKSILQLSVLSLGCFFLLAIQSCSSGSSGGRVGFPIRADVVTFDSSKLSGPSDLPTFRYGPQDFALLTNLDRLSGPAFRMLLGGNLQIFESAGSVITSREFSGYQLPELRYRVVDGVVKPLDSLSLSMLSASYQFDSLIQNIERLTGEKIDQFFGGQDGIRILFHPSIAISESDVQIKKFEKENAAYIAGTRQFALFLPAEEERVPMNINPQVISHEFGHLIFEKSFFNGNFQRCTSGELHEEKLFPGRLELEYVVRGINEGFADFVSFVWTGSANVLGSSLGEGKMPRERDFASSNLQYDDYSIGEGQVCQGRFYCIGTLWAKTLFDVYRARGLDPANRDARFLFLRDAVKLMQKTGESLRVSQGERLPVADQLTSSCLARDFLLPGNDGEMLASIFKSLLELLEKPQRKAFCQSLAKNFGTSGFPTSVQGLCI